MIDHRSVPNGKPYRIVQPWGPDKTRQATVVSDNHLTVDDAFAELDRLYDQMIRTGTRPEVLELLVADRWGRLVARRAKRTLRRGGPSSRPS